MYSPVLLTTNSPPPRLNSNHNTLIKRSTSTKLLEYTGQKHSTSCLSTQKPILTRKWGKLCLRSMLSDKTLVCFLTTEYFTFIAREKYSSLWDKLLKLFQECTMLSDMQFTNTYSQTCLKNMPSAVPTSYILNNGNYSCRFKKDVLKRRSSKQIPT